MHSLVPRIADQLVVQDADIAHAGYRRSKYRDRRHDFAAARAAFDMTQQRPGNVAGPLKAPLIDDLHRVPEQAADAAVAVAPGHFCPVNQFLVRMLIHSGLFNAGPDLREPPDGLGLCLAKLLITQ
ncbi:hypothetical protein BGX30_001278 [Mortierella sp. GBA39]|nr:hypothetical protein BGX30_001278 [Mortierella sp. GBA39]